ncbi:comEC family competence protein [bacterium BMS3Abin15]|nr:comEC family competence protein [bacterium BMS3Abin15]HDZ85934.1 MBL fold metallo-hydrolase [Candidatus Moranbacteria bacterium]
MLNRKLIYGLLIFLFTTSLIFGLVIFYSSASGELKVIFLDIGQGDAILISQGKNQILIDGGRDGKILLEKLGEKIPFWDRQIEIVIATHPDQDHIGGLINVLQSYKVNSILETKAESTSQTYKAWKEAVSKEDAENIEAKKNLSIKFSNDAIANILFPADSIDTNSKSNNEHSVVLKLDFGENSFLFTGDLPGNREKSLAVGEIDFLKVAHHGSKYSTSEEFLNKVNPNEAIISAGKNNRYGHPNQDVIKRLMERKIKIWRTDEMGDITYKCPPASLCRVIH